MEIPLSKEICTICFLKIPPTLDSEGKVIWCGENEAWPITEGLCCDLCEAHVVLPRRAKNTIIVDSLLEKLGNDENSKAQQ